jgi:hypothetical protein
MTTEQRSPIIDKTPTYYFGRESLYSGLVRKITDA